MFFRGEIWMTVGSPHPNTFSDRVRRNFFETSRRYTTYQMSCEKILSTTQHSTSTCSVLENITLRRISESILKCWVLFLFGTAYEIKTVTGKQQYNISCQTVGYSSQVIEQSHEILLLLSSPFKRSPQTARLYPNKQLLRMYEFAALVERTSIRFESRLCVDILMHERTEH